MFTIRTLLFFCVFTISYTIPIFVFAEAQAQPTVVLPLPQMQALLRHGDRTKDGAYHIGLDAGYEYPVDTSVHAIADGIVRYAQPASEFGYMVLIEHQLSSGRFVVSQYGHLSPRIRPVRVGQTVVAGQTIGVLGSKAENGGWLPHIHFALFHGHYSTAGGWRYYGHVRSRDDMEGSIEPYSFFNRHLSVEPNQKKPKVIAIQHKNRRAYIQVLNRMGSTHQLLLRHPSMYDDRLLDVAVGDLNRDGAKEIIFARAQNDSLMIDVWSTTGILLRHIMVEERIPEGVDLAIGNVVGSPHRELIIGLDHPSRVLVYSARGEKIATHQAFYTKRRSPIDIAVGNFFPEHKRQEIAVLSQQGKPRVSFLRGQGKRLGTFQPFRRLRYNGTITAADTTGDGTAEVIIGTRIDRHAVVRMFNALGQEMVDARYAPFGVGFRGRIDVAVSDWNDDGVKDSISSVLSGGRARIVVRDTVTNRILFDSVLYRPRYTQGLSIFGF